MSRYTLLVVAYALVWAFVFGYLLWLVRRQEGLRWEVGALRSLLVEQGGPKKGR